MVLRYTDFGPWYLYNSWVFVCVASWKGFQGSLGDLRTLNKRFNFKKWSNPLKLRGTLSTNTGRLCQALEPLFSPWKILVAGANTSKVTILLHQVHSTSEGYTYSPKVQTPWKTEPCRFLIQSRVRYTLASQSSEKLNCLVSKYTSTISIEDQLVFSSLEYTIWDQDSTNWDQSI